MMINTNDQQTIRTIMRLALVKWMRICRNEGVYNDRDFKEHCWDCIYTGCIFCELFRSNTCCLCPMVLFSQKKDIERCRDISSAYQKWSCSQTYSAISKESKEKKYTKIANAFEVLSVINTVYHNMFSSNADAKAFETFGDISEYQHDLDTLPFVTHESVKDMYDTERMCFEQVIYKYIRNDGNQDRKTIYKLELLFKEPK